MPRPHYEESAKIVKQAISALGEGKKGLAERLNLLCMEFIQKERGVAGEERQLDRDDKMYSVVKESVLGLSPNKDADLIHALYKVLKVAQKA